MKIPGWLQTCVAPLQSRKVRTALVTVLAAYAAQVGLGVSEDVIYTILGVGVSLILGIAHEDAGRAVGAEGKSMVGDK